MLRALPFVLLSAAGAAPAAAQVHFSSLGVPAGTTSSLAANVSADGRVVVGVRTVAGQPDLQLIRWTAEGGSEHIPSPPGMRAPFGNALNADGSMIVGAGSVNNRGTGFIWTRDAGHTLYPGLTFAGVSDNGNFLFGRQDILGVPFRWSQSNGREVIAETGIPNAISADGSVVIGQAGHFVGSGWRWTAATGQVSLGEIPTGFAESVPHGITPDGSTVVGFLTRPNVPDQQRAFRWTADDGYQVLAAIDGVNSIRAFDASATPSPTIIGSGFFDGNERAVIWTPDGRAHVLSDYLASLGAELDTWTLLRAESISDDGLTIAGNGLNPDGVAEGWVVHIPSPGGGMTLLACVLARRRRRWDGRGGVPRR